MSESIVEQDGPVLGLSSASADLTRYGGPLHATFDVDADARFKMVFDHAPIGQVYSDLSGVITSANEALASMLGYRPSDMVGRSTREFLSDEVYEQVRTDAYQLLDDDPAQVRRRVRRFVHKDGHDVPVAVTSWLLRDSAGEARWWVSMTLDLTEDERRAADLVSAHGAVLSAARDLRLQHAVAAAANEADSLDTVVPAVLGLVLDHFGWPAAALATWPAGSAECANGAGVQLDHVLGDAETVRGLLPHTRPDHADVLGHPGERCAALVPLRCSAGGSRALVFVAPCPELSPDQLDILATVALQTSQVHERAAIATELLEEQQRFRSVFDNAPMPMALTVGTSGTFGAVNAALCDLLGRAERDLIDRPASDFLYPDDRPLADALGAAAAAAPDGRATTLFRFLHSSGRMVYCNSTITWLIGPDGQEQFIAQLEDVTAFRAAEDALRWQADHDALTGLPNRSGLASRLARFGADASRVAVLFVDLDGFKLINDTRGHEAGDEVLAAVAQRLREAVRPGDFIARFGADEFVIVAAIADSSPRRLATALWGRITAALGLPVQTSSGPARVTASIGAVEGEVDAAEPQQLVQRADVAKHHAKELGRDRLAFYDDELHRHAIERVHTEALLRNALDDDRFVLHLQPIVRLDTSSIVGFESLIRLLDEDGELVPPGEFITVAEQSGLIVPMGTWVIQESCRVLADLRRRTGRPLSISVNVAAAQAARSDLAPIVLDAVHAAALPSGALTLELTESALLEADDGTLAQLVELRERGVDIALDDFGTGYSSLTYLRRLPVSGLKIDRSFVNEMMATPADRAIVRAVASLARDLGLQWVAEGVETIEQRRALRGIGAGLEQGFLFSPPLPVAGIHELLGISD